MEEGAESVAVVVAREAQRRWVPASAVRALPDPRLEARVSASDRAPKATVVDTLVLQEGVLAWRRPTANRTQCAALRLAT